MGEGCAGGYLLFSDCAANVIYKWQPNAPLSVFLERSGFTGTSNLNAGQQTVAGRLAILLIGSNGLALDRQGRLIITAMADRTLVRLEKDGSRTTLADRYEGKRFSGPNDVLVKSDGAIYFTDSVNGLRGGGEVPSASFLTTASTYSKTASSRSLAAIETSPVTFPMASRYRRMRKHCT